MRNSGDLLVEQHIPRSFMCSHGFSSARLSAVDASRVSSRSQYDIADLVEGDFQERAVAFASRLIASIHNPKMELWGEY